MSLGSLGRPQGIPGGPWEVPEARVIPKEFSSAMGVPFWGSLEGHKGSLGHIRGVFARSPGSPMASSGIPAESLRDGVVFGH